MTPRLLVMGGSTAAGLGARGRAWPVLVGEALGAAALLDLSSSGRLIDETLGLTDEIRAFEPTLAIIGLGGGESLVHPGPAVNRLIERFAPPSWHGVAGLQPRAYYSTTPRKRRRQRVTSLAKVGVKRAVITATGGRSRMEPEVFGEHLVELVGLLHGLGCDVAVLGMWRWDQRNFPRSGAVVARTDAIIRGVVAADPRLVLVPVEGRLRCWEDYLDDGMHFNEQGHARVAAAVLDAVTPLVERAAPPADAVVGEAHG